MLGKSTATGYLSTFATRFQSLRAAGVRPPDCTTTSTLLATMPKRKRTTAVKIKAVGDFSTTKVKKRDIAGADENEGEDFDSELTSIEEGSNSELNGNKKSKKKRAATKKKTLVKAMPEGNPVVSRKDRIKTEDENGDPITRAPQVNSDYLPLPWEGRLGYVSLPP